MIVHTLLYWCTAHWIVQCQWKGSSFYYLQKGKLAYYGPLNNERFPSIDSVIAHYSRTAADKILVKLTYPLIPDK